MATAPKSNKSQKPKSTKSKNVKAAGPIENVIVTPMFPAMAATIPAPFQITDLHKPIPLSEEALRKVSKHASTGHVFKFILGETRHGNPEGSLFSEFSLHLKD